MHFKFPIMINKDQIQLNYLKINFTKLGIFFLINTFKQEQIDVFTKPQG